MAKFNLKWSNIVKVVLVILLVVGLYYLVYNRSVFNFNMYEGLHDKGLDDKDNFSNILTNFKDLTDNIGNALNALSNPKSESPIDTQINKMIVDTQTLQEELYQNINYKNETDAIWEKLFTTINDAKSTSNKMTRIAHEGEKEIYKETLLLKQLVLDATKQFKDLKTKYLNIPSQSTSTLISSITSQSPSKTTETFDNLDQSINSSLMQPYASNKCGPINPAKFFFDNIEFKPDCCPSTYSSSQGCACLCPQQINYLNSRGGNRTLPTEY